MYLKTAARLIDNYLDDIKKFSSKHNIISHINLNQHLLKKLNPIYLRNCL